MNDAYIQRFGGIGRLYGQRALATFAGAHVCVVGIGGVGTWAAESLARSGIGQITLIDLDDICTGNDQSTIIDPVVHDRVHPDLHLQRRIEADK